MSNQIVSDGWSGPLVITDGWGSGAAIPAGKSILNFSTGTLLVDIEFVAGVPYLQFDDGVNSIYQELPFTDEQKAGTDWAFIKLVRTGGDLKIVVDKTVVATITLTQVKDYGGTLKIMELNPENLFDLRIVKNVVTEEASDYYQDDLSENSGNNMLPPPR